MPYREQYKHLAVLFPESNYDFETIAATILNHYSDVIQLEVLEAELQRFNEDEKAIDSAYLAWFKTLIPRMRELYTEGELVAHLHSVLNARDARLSRYFMFVPENAQDVRQIGLVESWGMGDQRDAVPLSRVDMLRFVRAEQDRGYRASLKVQVLSLNELTVMENPDHLRASNALVVDFNQSGEGPPKWGVMRRSEDDTSYEIYCEMNLSTTEQAALEEKFSGCTFSYTGGKADAPESTGYAAAAYLNNVVFADQRGQKRWTMDTEYDFLGLRYQFLFVYQSFIDSYSAEENVIPDSVSTEFRININNISKPACLSIVPEEHRPIGNMQEAIKSYQGGSWSSNELLKPQFTLPDDFDNWMKTKKYVEEKDDTISLAIPRKSAVCQYDGGFGCTRECISWYATNIRPGSRDYDIAIRVMMLVSLLRLRGKKSVIEIKDDWGDLPLDPWSKTIILDLLRENAFITDLIVGGNKELNAIKEELLPVFARNRWLQQCGYRPPLTDKYWEKAARYWLLHLRKTQNLLAAGDMQADFKRCVLEMGVQGLEHVLDYMSTNRDWMKDIYGETKPAFYVACRPEEYEVYLNTFTAYLSGPSSYFPFSELGISFQRGNDKGLAKLFTALNQNKSFEKVVLTDCLKHPKEAAVFIASLAQRAADENWQGVLLVPELDDPEVRANPAYLPLFNACSLLNNVILRNKRIQAAEKVLRPLQASEAARDDSLPLFDEKKADEPDEKKTDERDDEDSLNPDRTWPLVRGGPSLQLALQQQMAMEVQIQQEQQKAIVVRVVDKPVKDTLVTFDNIDSLLTGFYDKYRSEHSIWAKAKREPVLGEDKETELQAFFHTWISAAPGANAPQAIACMTQEAARELLIRHRSLPSGLNPDNLPMGFFTQRGSDGRLILCYDFEEGYVRPANALTLQLDVRSPVAERWKGDFRQFHPNAFTNVSETIGPKHLHDMALYAFMQQPLSRDALDEQIRIFQHKNPGVLPKNNISVARANWFVFLQCWEYGGNEGVRAFLGAASSSSIPSLSAGNALAQLLFPIDSNLKQWACQRFTDQAAAVRALGQVYYRLDNQGVLMLLAKLKEVEDVLGSEFFENFLEDVLGTTENLNCLMTQPAFSALNGMIEMLRTSPQKVSLWQAVMNTHMDSVGWDAENTFDTLWRGFEYFIRETEAMGLKWDGDELDEVGRQNMVVCMDRVLTNLRCLPPAQQQAFLRSLSGCDLSHGGVYYAVQYDGLKHIHPALKLHNFMEGTPSYVPEMAKVFTWPPAVRGLYTSRTLASISSLSSEDYALLSHTEVRPAQLVFLKHVYRGGDIRTFMSAVDSLPGAEAYANVILKAVYKHKNRQLSVSLETLTSAPVELSTVSEKYPHGTALEAAEIWYQKNKNSGPNFDPLLDLLRAPITKPAKLPDDLFHAGYRLAALFGMTNAGTLGEFFKQIADANHRVHQELRLLMPDLLSIDYAASGHALSDPAVWAALVHCVSDMQDHPAESAMRRQACINELRTLGVTFQFAAGRDIRRAKENDFAGHLDHFPGRSNRLSAFFTGHILVPREDEAAKAQLLPLFGFLKQLQLNRTLINEVEPLLSVLEKTDENTFWTASWLSGLLGALKPTDEKRLFPLSLVTALLKDPAVAAKPMNEAPDKFPEEWIDPLQFIVNNCGAFNRDQQAQLCRIALRECGWRTPPASLYEIAALLGDAAYAEIRTYMLEILCKAETLHAMEIAVSRCQRLLTQGQDMPAEQAKHWPATVSLWLDAVGTSPAAAVLYDEVTVRNQDDLEKQSLILHILAGSSLQMAGLDKQELEHILTRKSRWMAGKLSNMSVDALRLLAAFYPGKPAPDIEDVIRLYKKWQRNPAAMTWEACLSAFRNNPFTVPRPDYGVLVSGRGTDFERMLSDTRVSANDPRSVMLPEQSAKISSVFVLLKQLERGDIKLPDSDIRVCEMTPEALKNAFESLAPRLVEHPDDMLLRAHVWAVLFEALGRTTQKYPHLAQQFALIANDLGVKSDTRLLQLATGEGKSHFVALRAAMNAGQGKTVDVCTAKRTLAARDCEDYQAFFSYLGLSAAYVHTGTTRDEYEAVQIHYTTLGDLSLMMDRLSADGNPVVIDRKKRVALFDEFDYIRFEEGLKTEYNYARPTGKSPKQMEWFYHAVNTFYENHAEALTDAGEITIEDARTLYEHLQRIAGGDREKRAVIAKMAGTRSQQASWIQSASQVFGRWDSRSAQLRGGLENNKDFTVIEENVVMGEEQYLMRNIVPLSRDNQKMAGSTYSGGVHQLLASRLNAQAAAAGQSANFYVVPESDIISSQVAMHRMHTLWGAWEGFSGTISESQASQLYASDKTEILHVPTNRRDLRNWHPAAFFDEDKKRIDAMVVQLERCLDAGQSVLFACRDDTAVIELKGILQNKMRPELFAKLDFYTNADGRTASQVLADKKEREDWHLGKKRASAGLVASGFGRGDNVDVEAVFLFDVSDFNDQLQKGGRTARNGAEGEVFQFYLREDFIQEKTRLLERVFQFNNHFDHDEKSNYFTDEPSDDAALFEQVMRLREYEFGLTNAVNGAYHLLRAEYSDWTMELISHVVDPVVKRTLMDLISKQQNLIDQEWARIETDNAVENKISAISNFILGERVSERFAWEFREQNKGDVPRPLALTKDPVSPVPLCIPVRSAPRTAEEQACAEIFRNFVQLKHVVPENAQVFPVLLQQLAMGMDVSQEEYKEEDISADDLRKMKFFPLYAFAEEMLHCTDQAEFFDRLEIAVESTLHPSLPYLKTIRQFVGKNESLIEQHNNYLAENTERQNQFLSATKHARPLVMDNYYKFLAKMTLRSTNVLDTYVEPLFPLLAHISTWTKKEQEEWGPAYLQQAERLLAEIPPENLADVLHICGKMSFDHCLSFWRTAQAICGDHVERSLELLPRLVPQPGFSPEQTIRRLNDCMMWTSHFKGSDRKRFFVAFSAVMKRFCGEQQDIFDRLSEKTTRWWNKGDAEFRESIIALWERLAQADANPRAFDDFLRWSMTLYGKSWFEISMQGLLNLPPGYINPHLPQLDALWKTLPGNRRTNTEHMTACFRGLSHVADALKDNPQGELLRSKIASLNALQFDRLVMQMAANNADSMIIPALLDYYGRQSIYIPRAEDCSALIKVYDWMYEQGLQCEAFQNQLAHLSVNRFELLMEQVSLAIADDSIMPVLFDYYRRQADFIPTEDQCPALIRLYKWLNATQPAAQRELCLMQLSKLENPGRFQWLMARVGEPEWDDRMIPALLAYLTDPVALPMNNIERLYQALQRVVAGERTAKAAHKPYPSFEKLRQQVDDLRGIEEKDFIPDPRLPIFLKMTADSQRDVPEGLYDSVTAFLAALHSEAVRTSFLPTINKFYTVSKRHGSLSSVMGQDAEVKTLFDFSDLSEERRQERLRWMFLLKSGVFIRKNPPQGLWPWDQTQNDRLLESGFECYAAYTDSILSAQTGNIASAQRDLSAAQQLHLLRLAEEMRVIGTAPVDFPDRIEESMDNIRRMESGLLQLTSSYQASWFKSTNRTLQMTLLEEKLGGIIVRGGQEEGTTRYEEVLECIRTAKREAIRSDLNENRSRVFRLNRSGWSRYFTTLNHMQDLVLRHWVADRTGVERLHAYQAYHRAEFMDIVTCLREAVTDYLSEKYNEGDERFGDFSSRVTRFFSPQTYRTDLEMLRMSLQNFPGNGGEMQSNAVAALLTAVRESAPGLPGHLTVLANEVLIRGDAMNGILLDQENRPRI